MNQISKALQEYLKPYYDMAAKNQTYKFDKYIYPFKPIYHDNPNYLNPLAGFKGVEEIDGATVTLMFYVVQRACEFGDLHMHPGTEEYCSSMAPISAISSILTRKWKWISVRTPTM